MLEVHDRGGHVIRYTSKSLRCDDSYCARDAVSVLGASVGVHAIDQHLDADPPYIDITYEPRAIKLDDVTVTLAGILNAQSDPLYEGKLTVEMR